VTTCIIFLEIVTINLIFNKYKLLKNEKYIINYYTEIN